MYYSQNNNPAIVTGLENGEFENYTFKCPIEFNNIDEVRNQDIESIISKNLSLYNYYSYFQNVCLTLFNFFEMVGIKNTVFNTLLFNFGRFAIVKEKDGSYGVRLCIPIDYNARGEVIKIKAWKYVPLGYTTTVKDETFNYNDFVIFNVNATATPLKYYTFFFVSKIVDVQRGIDNNVWQQQQPVIVEATDEQKLAMTNFFEKITNKVKVIFTKRSMRADEQIKTINLGGEWTAEKGITVKEDYKREFFTFLGIDNIPFEKKERLITAEAGGNDMLLELSRNSMLMSLNESLREAKNKGFDLGVDTIVYSVEPTEKTILDEEDIPENENDETINNS